MSKTVLITGASSGFGQACAVKLAGEGYALILTARRFDALETLKQQLCDQVPVHIAALDVCCEDQIEQFFEQLPEAFQGIDILINNAGLALGVEPFDKTQADDWSTMVETNVMGLLRVTHRVLPGMVARNCGHIINIGSTAGNWPYPGSNVYGASKAFVQNFSRGLRADLLGKQVRVSNIEPGMAETNFSNTRFKGDHDKAAQVYADTQPLSGEDVADIIAWVVSTPAHVNINTLEVMPTCQAWGALPVDRSMSGK